MTNRTCQLSTRFSVLGGAMVFVVAATLTLPLTSTDASAANDKFRTSVVVAPACDPAISPGATCVIDALGAGRFQIEATPSGVEMRLALKRASLAGARVTLSGLRAHLLLSLDGGDCTLYESPTFDLVKGRLKSSLRFDGASTLPPISSTAGATVELCGDRLKISAPGGGGDEIVAGDGVVRGGKKPKSELRSTIKLNPDCDPAVTIGADCAADFLSSASLRIRSSSKAGDDGLRMRLAASDIRKSAAPVTSADARLVVSVAANGGSCFDILSPRLGVVGGAIVHGSRKFRGDETLPPTASLSGDSLALCGKRVQLYLSRPGSGSDLVGIAGVEGGQ